MKLSGLADVNPNRVVSNRARDFLPGADIGAGSASLSDIAPIGRLVSDMRANVVAGADAPNGLSGVAVEMQLVGSERVNL
jgi:hypothetical protein